MTTSDPLESNLPVTPVVLEILVALGEGPSHGYGVAQSVRSRSGGRIRLPTGPLYRYLKRLLDDGLIEEAHGPRGQDDPRRGAYYRLTPLGRRVVAAETERLSGLLATAKRAGLTEESSG